MAKMSDFRNYVLRKAYEKSQSEPVATFFAVDTLVAAFSKPIPPHWVKMVIDELSASGLIELSDDATGLRLTAKGAYEAEQLGGSFRTPAIARIWHGARNYERLGVILAAVGLVVAIIAFAYPEYTKWQEQKATAVLMEDAASRARIVQEGEMGMGGMEMAMEVDEFCKANPETKEYRGNSCEISRGEREATLEEARKFCLERRAAFSFGGKDCAQFRE